MTGTRCAEFAARDAAERYVAGTLAGAEAEEFERHLVGCASCQSDVRLGAAIRRELPASGGAMAAGTRRTRTRVFALIGFALAASIVAVVAVRTIEQRDWRTLGAIGAPPAYGGIAVRSAARGDSAFEDAMRLYGAGRFAEARHALEEARRAGADSTVTSFFLGVSHLLDDDAPSALTELAVVIGRGPSPYLSEAHYYSAKAWLRRGQRDSALAQLDAAQRIETVMLTTMRALADSVRGRRP